MWKVIKQFYEDYLKVKCFRNDTVEPIKATIQYTEQKLDIKKYCINFEVRNIELEYLEAEQQKEMIKYNLAKELVNKIIDDNIIDIKVINDKYYFDKTLYEARLLVVSK